jgi:hypothetical protein
MDFIWIIMSNFVSALRVDTLLLLLREHRERATPALSDLRRRQRSPLRLTMVRKPMISALLQNVSGQPDSCQSSTDD